VNTLFSVLPIVFRRVSANIRLLTAVVVGAVLASALMSTTSIYTDAIRDLGLSYALRQSGPDKNNILETGGPGTPKARDLKEDADCFPAKSNRCG